MKATYVKAPDLVELREVPMPEPAPHEVLIKLAACGVCGTDLHIAFHLATDWQPLGHELSGTVAKVGPGVSRVGEGERVTVECGTACGLCRECRRGHPGRCRQTVGFYGKEPGYADYIRVHERTVVPVGDLDPLTTTLIEPFTVALGAVSKIEPQPDDTVLIIGPGPIGLMALAACRRIGARRTVLVGRSHSVARLRMGEALGADRVVRVDQEDLAGVIKRELPDGVDKVISTGHPDSVATAVDLINRDGVITYIGLTGEERTPLTIDAHRFHWKQLQLKPFAGPSSPFFHLAIDYLRQGVIPVDRFVTDVFPLERVGQALRTAATAKERTIKIAVTMDGQAA
jgi:L-iditol 2-dehydrogenase